MAVTLCKRHVAGLETAERKPFLQGLVKEIQTQWLKAYPEEEGYVHGWDAEYTMEDCHHQEFALHPGDQWYFTVVASIPTEPGGDEDCLEVEIKKAAFEQDDGQASSEEPSSKDKAVAVMAGIPAVLALLTTWAWAFSRHFLLEPGTPNYMGRTAFKWAFIGGIVAGGGVLFIALFILMGLRSSLGAIFGRKTPRKPLEEQALADAIDLSGLAWPSVST